jgi:hypothetical protein
MLLMKINFRKAVEMLATQGLTNSSICSQSQVASYHGTATKRSIT